MTFLTNYDYLKLLCFSTDLGYIFSRFQQLLQGDYVLIFNIQSQSEAFKVQMNNLKTDAVPGGWKNTFEKLKITERGESENDECTEYKLHRINLLLETTCNKRCKV